MRQMKAQAENVGTHLVSDYIVDVDLSSRPFKATGDSGTVYTGDTVVIATGAKARWLGLPSEEKFQGKGVSACALVMDFSFATKKSPLLVVVIQPLKRPCS